MLKPSKFNHSVFNNRGELLMFNSYTGRMVKTSLDNSDYAKGVLHDEKTYYTNEVVFGMQEAGLLVDSDEDENIKVHGVHLKMQTRSILTLVILPTEQCNFRCVYCPEAFNRGEMSEKV